MPNAQFGILKSGRLRRAGASAHVSKQPVSFLDFGNEGPAVVLSVLKGRLGHFGRPEGRGEPFRARDFAEPAPFAALSAAFSARINIGSIRIQLASAPKER